MMGSFLRRTKFFPLVAFLCLAGLTPSVYGMSCESTVTLDSPESRRFVESFRTEGASRLGITGQELEKSGLFSWILKGRKAPERIVFFSLNPRRGDLIINFLPDLAAVRKLFPRAQIILLTPHKNLIQGFLPNVRNVQLKYVSQFARKLYDSYKYLSLSDLPFVNGWDFQPFLAQLEGFFDSSTLVVANPDLKSLLVAARESEYEDLRQSGLDLTHFTFFTNFVENKVCDDFHDALAMSVRQSASALIELRQWPRTVNLRTENERTWQRLGPEFEKTRIPVTIQKLAYALPGLRREITFGRDKVDLAPAEFFLPPGVSLEGAALLRSLPTSFVLINMSKGEQRRLNQVETQSAVFLEKMLSRLLAEYPDKNFVVLDYPESWRTIYERVHNPSGSWMTAVKINRLHFMSLLGRIGHGRLQIVSAKEEILPLIILRAKGVITQDSGLSHTAVSILGPEKVLMLSIDDMGRRWAAPNQPTVYRIDSWSRISNEKLEEILSQFRTLIAQGPG